MQIEFFGANCLRIKAAASLVFDDNLVALGRSSVTTENDVVCLTNNNLIEAPAKAQLVFDSPGAYEVGGIRLAGIAAQAHLDEPEKPLAATIYRGSIDSSRLTFVVAGHIAPGLSDEQVELLGHIDVLIVPVGGGGYTLDATGAVELVKKTNPKLIVPTHYSQPDLKYPVAQAAVTEFVVASGLSSDQVEGSFRVKRSDFGEQPAVVIIKPKSKG